MWRRPNTTKEVINAIKSVKPSSLYIACDGPRLDVEGELEKVNATKDLAMQSIDWECKVKTRFSKVNLGCRDGVSSAISWFFKHVSEGIILEDDVVPYPEFFEYCQLCLNRYRKDNRIWGISSSLRAKEQKIIRKYTDAPLYLRYSFSCCGWATWSDRWSDYSPSLDKNWMNLHSQNVENFCGKTSGVILKKALNASKKNPDSWTSQVTALITSQLQFVVHPGICLIKNIGFGPDAAHTTTIDPNFFMKEDEKSREKWLFLLKQFFSKSKAMPPFIREVSDLLFIKPSLSRRIKGICWRLLKSIENS